MDIQVSSNFERLLFETLGRDAPAVRRLMAEPPDQSGMLHHPRAALARIRAKFGSGACNEAETAREIDRVLGETAELIDPHTAVGCHVGRFHMLRDTPMVVLRRRIRRNSPMRSSRLRLPPRSFPAQFARSMARPERFDVLPKELDAVKTIVQRA